MVKGRRRRQPAVGLRKGFQELQDSERHTSAGLVDSGEKPEWLEPGIEKWQVWSGM